MGQVFDLKTTTLAVGDPTMSLALYQLSLPVGAYRLGSQAFRRATAEESSDQPTFGLDSPYAFAMDAAHIAAFDVWYHRLGKECSYTILTLVERLSEFESAVGSRIGFYWEHEVAGGDREGRYILDPAGVVKLAEPDVAS